MYEQDGVLYLIAGEKEERVRIYEEAGEPADMYVLPPEIMTRVSVATRETSQIQPPAYAIQSILEQEKAHNVCKVYELQLTYDKVRDEYADDTSEDYLQDVYLTMNYGGKGRSCIRMVNC